jgi:hypothetical protein
MSQSDADANKLEMILRVRVENGIWHNIEDLMEQDLVAIDHDSASCSINTYMIIHLIHQAHTTRGPVEIGHAVP